MADARSQFVGYINSVRVHGGVLSPEDVANNFAAGPSVADFSALIRQVAVANDTMTFTCTTIPGRSYLFEYTDSLTPPSWHSLPPAQTATGSTLTITNPPAAGRQRFYRVALLH